MILTLLTLTLVSHPQDTDPAEAFRTGNYEEAIELATSAFNDDRSDPEMARLLARAHAITGDYEAAEETAREFQRRNRDSPELWTTLGEVLIETGELREARNAFSRALEEGATDSVVARFGVMWLDVRQGEIGEVQQHLSWFLSHYRRARLSDRELVATARAIEIAARTRYQFFQDALRVFDMAHRQNPANQEALVRAGLLLLDKYQGADASESFQQVLAVNPRHPGALLGMAKKARFDGVGSAMDMVTRAIDVNPHYVEAHVFLALLYAELEDYDRAAEQVEFALITNPNSLEALGMQASIAYMASDPETYEDTRDRALDINPSYAGIFATAAELAARNRRYSEAAALASQGVAVDSTSWESWGLMGMNQLRIGQIDAGRRNLEISFQNDPFNVWSKNTLDLVDTFAGFETFESDNVRFTAEAPESELLQLYAVPLAQESFEHLSSRYGWAPDSAIRVEFFPTHADFSVRTVGLAGIGALGVSFGPVIAMDSPSARNRGEFNWGSTLWHEMTHTINLGQTEHRIPRWLAEGLAVYEERRARQGWGDYVTYDWVAAWKGNLLLPVSQLNDGFVRPSYPQHVVHSYFQASLVCELIERDWGFDAILQILDGYREGRSTEEILPGVTGISMDELDERFRIYVEQEFAEHIAVVRAMGEEGVPEEPAAASGDRDFAAQLVAGKALLQQADTTSALIRLEQAKQLFPEYAQADSPYWLLSGIYESRGNLGRAVAQLRQQVAFNQSHYDARLKLGDLLLALGDTTGAIESFDASMYIHPYDVERHRQLAELMEGTGDFEGAARERRAVIALRPADMVDAYYLLARTLLDAGELSQARRAVLRALEMAPNYEDAQDLLLEIRNRRRSS